MVGYPTHATYYQVGGSWYPDSHMQTLKHRREDDFANVAQLLELSSSHLKFICTLILFLPDPSRSQPGR